MIVMGAKDPAFPHPQAEVGAVAAALLAGTTVTWIDAGGHYPPAQFSTQAAAAMRPFLADHAEHKLAGWRQP
jgi:hypothetical protein